MNNVDMENTAPDTSAHVGCKRKAGTRGRDTPSKKKRTRDGSTIVRRALNKCTKQSVLYSCCE